MRGDNERVVPLQDQHRRCNRLTILVFESERIKKRNKNKQLKRRE